MLQIWEYVMWNDWKQLVQEFDLERCSVFEDNENGSVVYQYEV